MESERIKQWFAFARFFLGTFAIGLVTLIANHQIQERELEIKEQEAIGHFLDQALTKDVAVRRRFAQYFANVTRSDELRERWMSYLNVVESEYKETQIELSKAEKEVQDAIKNPQISESPLASALIDKKVAQVDALRAALTVTPTQASEQVTPRVYFHIRSDGQRSSATKLGDVLSSTLSVTVPGVQRVVSGPEKTELRYFNSANSEEAKTIATVLAQQSGLSVQAVYISGYEGSTLIRPGHYELWLSKDAFMH